MTNPYLYRDNHAERVFLTVIQDLTFVIMQRDWQQKSHGDLDLILDQTQWDVFVERVLKFAQDNQYRIVNAFEIEIGVVKIELLTSEGTIHLDVSLSKSARPVFGVDPMLALERRDCSGLAPVVHPDDARVYTETKRKYKRSPFQCWMRRLRNLPVILRRIREGALLFSGGALYIPYAPDRDIPSSEKVIRINEINLQTKLRGRYKI